MLLPLWHLSLHRSGSPLRVHYREYHRGYSRGGGNQLLREETNVPPNQDLRMTLARVSSETCNLLRQKPGNLGDRLHGNALVLHPSGGFEHRLFPALFPARFQTLLPRIM